ncbi:conserved hypothetical protein [Frankia canadensis]|uniref:TIR domain-containing protein n=1 Tax=Frankia canadensis TaxID=1836972 RepID=A0A2I2KS42_9ACTN|nr:TIR domain-containing protein [Frankia canadensis]SNQ48480.1 conserved hypothetical protein [Frankia canadensis]SOU55770.1 conserved hypothetical protein [Frankia canadensis]
MSGADARTAGADFFISYTRYDRSWAEWIAWELERAGYRVTIQAWDFVPGNDWRGKMEEAFGATRTIAVLSRAYLTSFYGREEWQAAQQADPGGFERKLLPVRIEDCERPEPLRTWVSIDLFDLGVNEARRRLLAGVRGALEGRMRPDVAPNFPSPPWRARPTAFPGPGGPRSSASAAPVPGAGAADGADSAWFSSPASPPIVPVRDAAGQRSDSVRFSPIGSYLVGHRGWVSSVRFSPDGRTLASGGGDAVRLWEVSDPHQARRLGAPLHGHTRGVHQLAFSPNGALLASASEDHTVMLWNVHDPRNAHQAGTSSGHARGVWSVAFSPDGHTLASAGDDHTIRLWDVEKPHEPRPLGPPLTDHTDSVRSVAFSPDGRTLASAGDDRRVLLWDISDPRRPHCTAALFTNTIQVWSIAFSPDSRTLAGGAGGEDHTVLLWNIHSLEPEPPQSLAGHSGWVASVAFAPDGRTLATGSSDKTVRLWDLRQPHHPRPLGTPLVGHTERVMSVSFAPDGNTLASAGRDQDIRLWTRAPNP